MNRARDQFFTSAGLAKQQHCRVRRRHLIEPEDDVPPCRALANEHVLYRRVSWTLERSLITIRKTTSGCFLVLDRWSRRRERSPIIDETTNRIGDRVQRLERMRIQLRLRALGVQRDCAAVVALGPERHNDQRPNPERPEVKVVVRRKDGAAAMRRA